VEATCDPNETLTRRLRASCSTHPRRLRICTAGTNHDAINPGTDRTSFQYASPDRDQLAVAGCPAYDYPAPHYHAKPDACAGLV
jgi:hypothetical protein